METKSRRSRTRVLLCIGLLAIGVTATAQTAASDQSSHRCSNRTLKGSYGFLLDGTDLASGFPFRGVVMQTYDGNGGITQVDHVVFNGTPPPVEWAPGTGTCSVNSDCTGVALLHTFTGDVSLHFVVTDNGKQIKQVVDANAVTAVGNRVN